MASIWCLKIMVVNEIITEYYKNEADKLRKQLRKALERYDEESIHKLRVTIKKLKALFHLFEGLYPGKLKTKECRDELEPVFKSAGQIRKAQLNRKIFSKLGLKGKTARAYKSDLDIHGKKARKEFRKAAAHFDLRILQKLKIKKLSAATKDKEFEKAFGKTVKEELGHIHQLLKAGNNPAIIHKIRKHVRTLSAITALAQKTGTTVRLKKVLAFGKKSGTLIGDWHDQEALVVSVEHFFKNADVENDKQLIALVEKLNAIKNKNNLFFEKLKKQMMPELRFLDTSFS